MFLRCTESHDLLDPCAVVPGPIEQHYLASGRQLRDVTLEEPLSAFPVGRRRQSRDADDAGAEVFGDPFDGAALARGVAALEDDDDPHAGVSGPFLHLYQFRLQPE